jgi:hypothetical protein
MADRLHPSDVDAIATRVVELLATQPPAPHTGGLLTTAQAAQRLGRTQDWVRQHRHQLGLIASQGARPRLLFNAQAVAAYGDAHATRLAAQPAPTELATRRRRITTTVDLLPIRGHERNAA